MGIFVKFNQNRFGVYAGFHTALALFHMLLQVCYKEVVRPIGGSDKGSISVYEGIRNNVGVHYSVSDHSSLHGVEVLAVYASWVPQFRAYGLQSLKP